MNCPKCDGYLERDHGYEYVVQSRPAYRCINCGKYIDQRIVINTTPGREVNDVTRTKGTPCFTRSVNAYRVARNGRVVLR